MHAKSDVCRFHLRKGTKTGISSGPHVRQRCRKSVLFPDPGPPKIDVARLEMRTSSNEYAAAVTISTMAALYDFDMRFLTSAVIWTTSTGDSLTAFSVL